MKKHFTYINKLPNGTPFYIGVGSYNPNKRGFKSKVWRAYSRSGRTLDWQMAAKNGFESEIVFWSDVKSECHQKEIELIKLYGKTINGGTLVNVSDGGYSDLKGKKLPQWWCDKISQNVQGKNNVMYGKRGQETANARLVLDHQTGIFYESVTEAADIFGFKMKSLYNMLSGFRKNKTPLKFV
jgi:hypothetical protein